MGVPTRPFLAEQRPLVQVAVPSPASAYEAEGHLQTDISLGDALDDFEGVCQVAVPAPGCAYDDDAEEKLPRLVTQDFMSGLRKDSFESHGRAEMPRLSRGGVSYKRWVTKMALRLREMEAVSKDPIDVIWVDALESGRRDDAFKFDEDWTMSAFLGKRPPPGAEGYPGMFKFKVMTPRVWEGELLGFATAAILEALNLQSAVVLAVSLFRDDKYDVVPFEFRAAFVSSLAFSFILGIAISARVASFYDQTSHLGVFAHWKAIAKRAILEWLSATPNVLHAESRFVRQGKANRGAKNFADPDLFPFPIIGEGFGATVKYQNQQTFLSKLPQKFFQDFVCFFMNVYMERYYLGTFTTVMLVSSVFSCVMICKKIMEVHWFITSAQSFRQYMGKVATDLRADPEAAKTARQGLRQLGQTMPWFASSDLIIGD